LDAAILTLPPGPILIYIPEGFEIAYLFLSPLAEEAAKNPSSGKAALMPHAAIALCWLRLRNGRMEEPLKNSHAGALACPETCACQSAELLV